MSDEPRENRLGIFVPLMKRYGQLTPDVKRQVDHAVEAYRLHLLSEADFQQRLDALLGLTRDRPALRLVPPPEDDARARQQEPRRGIYGLA